jgi:hypothetical protein
MQIVTRPEPADRKPCGEAAKRVFGRVVRGNTWML